MRFSLAITALIAVQQVAAASSANPDNPEGTVLYITSPACGSYKCVVEWSYGETVLVNWLAPPPGKVSVSLASNNGGSTYSIAPSFPAVNTICDAGAGPGVAVKGATCGSLSFVVPGGWAQRANYTVMVASLSDPTQIGYTDAVTVGPANSTSAVVPSGTSVSIIGAAASTSSVALATSASAGSPTTAAIGSSTKAPISTSSTSSSTTVSNSTKAASANDLIINGGISLAAMLAALTLL